MLIPEYISGFLLQDESWKTAFEGLFSNANDLSSNAVSDCLRIMSVMVDEAPVGVVVVAPTDKIILVNRAAQQLMQYNRAAEPTATWSSIRLRKDFRSNEVRPLTEDIDPLYIALRERRRNMANVLVKSIDADYEEWVSITAFPVLGNGGLVIAAVAIIQDISDFMDMQEIMHDQAIHDPLTGLSNRALFSGNLAMAMARARRAGSGGAVLLIDLDRFKGVNDVHGYIAGDDLLSKVARRLHAEVRGTDTVSRIGEDEFAVVLADIADQKIILSVVAEISQRICDSVGVVYRVIGREVTVTASIGVSLYPHDGMDEKTLVSKAAAALHHVKVHGRNNWKYYHELENPVK
ncbi:MAG: sensor domain-containing diguanylate cyclase [Synergistaceae bacterium]|nr:sensor domain-containing diguanylate cyclase [Synergistaceae bacterium]